jgi:hypothetical protein
MVVPNNRRIRAPSATGLMMVAQQASKASEPTGKNSSTGDFQPSDLLSLALWRKAMAVQIGLAVRAQVSTLGQRTTQKAFGVLVDASLPFQTLVPLQVTRSWAAANAQSYY